MNGNLRSSTPLLGWFALALVPVLCLADPPTGIQNGLFNTAEHWTVSPPGGHPGPRIASLGSIRGILMGRHETTGADGNADSRVSQSFECDQKAESWCTVEFDGRNEQKDGELLKITLRSGDKSRVGYMGKQLSMQHFSLSIRGCGDNEVRFEMTKGSQNSLQSSALINQVRSTCSDRDRTNIGRYKLLNDGGKPLQ